MVGKPESKWVDGEEKMTRITCEEFRKKIDEYCEIMSIEELRGFRIGLELGIDRGVTIAEEVWGGK